MASSSAEARARALQLKLRLEKEKARLRARVRGSTAVRLRDAPLMGGRQEKEQFHLRRDQSVSYSSGSPSDDSSGDDEWEDENLAHSAAGYWRRKEALEDAKRERERLQRSLQQARAREKAQRLEEEVSRMRAAVVDLRQAVEQKESSNATPTSYSEGRRFDVPSPAKQREFKEMVDVPPAKEPSVMEQYMAQQMQIQNMLMQQMMQNATNRDDRGTERGQEKRGVKKEKYGDSEENRPRHEQREDGRHKTNKREDVQVGDGEGIGEGNGENQQYRPSSAIKKVDYTLSPPSTSKSHRERQEEKSPQKSQMAGGKSKAHRPVSSSSQGSVKSRSLDELAYHLEQTRVSDGKFSFCKCDSRRFHMFRLKKVKNLRRIKMDFLTVLRKNQHSASFEWQQKPCYLALVAIRASYAKEWIWQRSFKKKQTSC
mmetsp:Transcript_48547/g.125964  ORF Transcript_48547/g.125964 Transcript_48547/m.125964 type:complete len:428 (-) Transcript_48547:401-1684(-)